MKINTAGVFAQRVGRALCKIVTFIQVGKIHVVGRENLPADPVLICCNHPHYADVFVLPIALQRWLSYMTHREVFRFGFGIFNKIVQWFGGFSNGDGTVRGAAKACALGATALKTGCDVAVFPEGLTSFRSEMQAVSRGAIRILRLAQRQSNESAVIVPVHIRYGRYPGTWIQSYSYPVKYVLMLLCFWRFRRGATVTIGEPISVMELPSDEKMAVQQLASRISALDRQAKACLTAWPEYKSAAR